MKKKVIKVFKDCELKITIKTNLHIVNFLDITLDLRNNTYEQYRKQDNHPVYIIHQPINSNYPKTILRELPKSISKRLSDLSSNKEIFQKATPIYFEALKKSGFNEPLLFIPKTNTSDSIRKKQRKRKIIWFNPLFSLSVRILKLLKQHFPKSNRLNKIFNKNTVEVCYSCMSNLSSTISCHNKRLLRPRITEYGCYWRTKENCLLQNQCLMPNLTYRVDVENNVNKGTKIYFGLTETSFKARFANHNKYFNHGQYKKSTELSKYICLLKENQITSRIRWTIVEKVFGWTKINYCPLGLAENLHLIEHFNDNRSLNKRNEFISECKHQVKLLLKSFKRKKDVFNNNLTLIVIYKIEFLCFWFHYLMYLW